MGAIWLAMGASVEDRSRAGHATGMPGGMLAGTPIRDPGTCAGVAFACEHG